MVLNHFMTVNPQTNPIWVKIKTNRTKEKGGYYRRFYDEWNTRERYVQES